jgi:hypothetical protein
MLENNSGKTSNMESTVSETVSVSELKQPFLFDVTSDILQCEFMLAMLTEFFDNYEFDIDIASEFMEALDTIFYKHLDIDTPMQEGIGFITNPSFFIVIKTILEKICSVKRRSEFILFPMDYIGTSKTENSEWIGIKCLCAINIIYETTSNILAGSSMAYENSNFICYTRESLSSIQSLVKSFPVSFLSTGTITAANIAKIYTNIAIAQTPVRYLLYIRPSSHTWFHYPPC